MVDVDYTDAKIVVATREAEAGRGRSPIPQGHSDVVPPGAEELWGNSPFEPVVWLGWMHGHRTGALMPPRTVRESRWLNGFLGAGGGNRTRFISLEG